MRGRALAAVVLGAVAMPAAASGQAVIFESGPLGAPTHVSEATVRVTGAVTIDFHGDEASGCAEAPSCGLSGTVTWDPAGRGQLVALGYRDHGAAFEDGYIVLNENEDKGPQPATFARVRRDPGGGAPANLCSDVGGAGADVFGFGPHQGNTLELGVLGAGGFGAQPATGLRTRCAGPTAADVSGLLPTRLIAESELRRGPHKVDFSADREFAAGGFSGTVHSTVVLHIARARPVLLEADEPPGPTVKERIRTLEVSYRVERVSGQVFTGVHGLADPDLCGPLDACGLMGSLTIAPRASSGDGIVFVQAPGDQPWSDLRRAAGLAPGGPPRGVEAYGFIGWTTDGGAVTSDLSRDGAVACTDSVPLSGGGGVGLGFSGRGVRAAYGDGEQSPGDLMATRCPGPLLSDVAGAGALASARVPLRTFAARTVTLRMRNGRAYSADGYSGATQPDVSVEMRRIRVKRRTIVFQVPEEFARVLARIRR